MKTRTAKLLCMIGPDGQFVVGEEDAEARWIMDVTGDWDCEELDIRRAILTVEVPVLGPARPIALEAKSIEVI